ncbi:NADPH-dependent F420 reductase [Variovorax sp. GT1P44]|uniref:NADPH-dependent F420 reductase n=1 Tax=Variovorax sp. GT1P44 TaxID=3443742 RepID=UPI003F488289
MHIGLIGAGQVAQSFARKAVDAGHNVLFSNSQGPDSLASLTREFGPLASAGTLQDAVNHPVVLLALPWLRVETVLRELPPWRGQILIDPTNGFRTGNPADGLADFQGGSSSELVATLAPGARVVKALNTMLIAGHDFFLPWPAPRSFPAFNGEREGTHDG